VIHRVYVQPRSLVIQPHLLHMWLVLEI
jgi:hypothetical protein